MSDRMLYKQLLIDKSHNQNHMVGRCNPKFDPIVHQDMLHNNIWSLLNHLRNVRNSKLYNAQGEGYYTFHKKHHIQHIVHLPNDEVVEPNVKYNQEHKLMLVNPYIYEIDSIRHKMYSLFPKDHHIFYTLNHISNIAFQIDKTLCNKL